MKPIISITQRAAEHLKELLAARVRRSGQCLRLVAAPGGAGLLLDRVQKDDVVIRMEGTPVLLVASPVVAVLEGTTLDCTETPSGPQLTLSK